MSRTNPLEPYAIDLTQPPAGVAQTDTGLIETDPAALTAEAPEAIDYIDDEVHRAALQSLAPSPFKVRPRLVEMLFPFADRVIVRPDDAEEMIGSFYVPDTAQQRPARGTVVAVGRQVTAVAPGDRVVYGHFTGMDVMHAGNPCIAMREDDLIARVETWEAVPETPSP